MEYKKLGIVGGKGPLATAYFFKRIVELTDAKTDQEHIDSVIVNNVKMIDRSYALLNNKGKLIEEEFIKEVEDMKHLGADIIAIPCNTFFCFVDEKRDFGVKLVNIISETIDEVKRISGSKKVGILATTGTIEAGLYQNGLSKEGIEFDLPDQIYQDKLIEILYDKVKANKSYSMSEFYEVVDNLKKKGCEVFLLGCTELSIIYNDQKLGEEFVDSSEALAKKVVELFGKSRR